MFDKMTFYYQFITYHIIIINNYTIYWNNKLASYTESYDFSVSIPNFQWVINDIKNNSDEFISSKIC